MKARNFSPRASSSSGLLIWPLLTIANRPVLVGRPGARGLPFRRLGHHRGVLVAVAIRRRAPEDDE